MTARHFRARNEVFQGLATPFPGFRATCQPSREGEGLQDGWWAEWGGRDDRPAVTGPTEPSQPEAGVAPTPSRWGADRTSAPTRDKARPLPF
jgi:hypothetical protein